MYALKVRINDAAPIIAGADDLGVFNAIVSCGPARRQRCFEAG
jgi:hypothetical protein